MCLEALRLASACSESTLDLVQYASRLPIAEQMLCWVDYSCEIPEIVLTCLVGVAATSMGESWVCR